MSRWDAIYCAGCWKPCNEKDYYDSVGDPPHVHWFRVSESDCCADEIVTREKALRLYLDYREDRAEGHRRLKRIHELANSIVAGIEELRKERAQC